MSEDIQKSNKPITAWKVLKVGDDGLLYSPIYQSSWPPDVLMEAKDFSKDLQPGQITLNNPGIHAVGEDGLQLLKEYFTSTRNNFLVRLNLYGTVYEGSHPDGYTTYLAEKAKVAEIMGFNDKKGHELAGVYNVTYTNILDYTGIRKIQQTVQKSGEFTAILSSPHVKSIEGTDFQKTIADLFIFRLEVPTKIELFNDQNHKIATIVDNYYLEGKIDINIYDNKESTLNAVGVALLYNTMLQHPDKFFIVFGPRFRLPSSKFNITSIVDAVSNTGELLHMINQLGSSIEPGNIFVLYQYNDVYQQSAPYVILDSNLNMILEMKNIDFMKDEPKVVFRNYVTHLSPDSKTLSSIEEFFGNFNHLYINPNKQPGVEVHHVDNNNVFNLKSQLPNGDYRNILRLESDLQKCYWDEVDLLDVQYVYETIVFGIKRLTDILYWYESPNILDFTPQDFIDIVANSFELLSGKPDVSKCEAIRVFSEKLIFPMFEKTVRLTDVAEKLWLQEVLDNLGGIAQAINNEAMKALKQNIINAEDYAEIVSCTKEMQSHFEKIETIHKQ